MGLWKFCSCFAFRVAHQMAQRVTKIFAKSFSVIEFCIVESHNLALSSLQATMCSTSSSSTRAHTHFDMWQSINAWRHQSGSALHKKQVSVSAIWALLDGSRSDGICCGLFWLVGPEFFEHERAIELIDDVLQRHGISK